jgi:hypothetical protein
MKHKSFISFAITIIYVLFSFAANAGNNAASETQGDHNKIPSQEQTHKADAGKHIPGSSEGHSNSSHGKTHTPHSEELPHIHKFHKERVKRIKKHHGLCWLLTKVILALCHLSILVIAYLHAAH